MTKKKDLRPVLFLLSALFLFVSGGGSPSFGQNLVTYKTGVMTKSYDERRAKAMEKFEEIIGKYIEERARIRIQLKPMTYPDLARSIEKGEIDFVWGYGLLVSADLSRRFPLLPFMAPTLGSDKRTQFKRIAVTTKEEAIQGIRDLTRHRGKRLTFVGDELWSFELLVFKVWAAETYGIRDISQILTLRGRDPDEGFFIPASKKGAIYSLFIKEADLAVAHEFEYLTQERLTPTAIRERTEVFPLTQPSEGFTEAPLFARRGLDPKDLARLTQVLIGMPDDPEGKQILLSSKISGFAKASDQEYQSVKALLVKKEKLGIK